MADLSVTATSVLASTLATTEARWNFGTTFTQGETGYVDSSNTWQKANATTSSTTALVGGIALNAGGAGQPARFVTYDPQFTPGATLATGAIYVLSGNSGKIMLSSDLGTGARPNVLFVAYSATQATMRIINGTAAIP